MKLIKVFLILIFLFFFNNTIKAKIPSLLITEIVDEASKILSSSDPVESKIIKLRDLLLHRGPDNGGLWMSDDKSIAFAHRRLAIIDLNQESNQPLIDDKTKNQIIFNGEIYNFIELRKELVNLGYSFKTSSDTEVILLAYDAWGHECLERLIGMFSFCIYDFSKNEFFLARDRAGEKPLFYSLTENNFIFSSELKPILEYGHKDLNLDSLDCYLSFGYTQAEKSILKGVNKLPPAHAMTIDLDSYKKKRNDEIGLSYLSEMGYLFKLVKERFETT